ncbi:beta barrel domain-containing protein [Acinetobacter baumannii]
MLKSELEVGQTVCLVPNFYLGKSSRLIEVQITKIARKYAYTTNPHHKIILSDGPLCTEKDYTGLFYIVWKSKADYEEHMRKQNFIGVVKNRLAKAKLSYSDALELNKWFEERSGDKTTTVN